MAFKRSMVRMRKGPMNQSGFRGMQGGQGSLNTALTTMSHSPSGPRTIKVGRNTSKGFKKRAGM